MDNTILFLISYAIFTLICFHISLIFIMKKIEMNWILALIPFVNLYHYMKIIKLNPVWIFIPGFNIIVFIASPILLGYHFGLSYLLRDLGLFFPGLLFLYVAFNPKVKYIHRKLSNLNLNSYKDIDVLEKRIEEEIEEYNNESDLIKKKKKKKKRKDDYVEPEHKPNLADILDQKLSTMQKEDVIVTDADLINVVSPTLDKKDENKNREELLLDYDYDDVSNLNSNDTFDDINEEKVTLEGVQKIEKESIESNKKEIVDNATYEELKDEEKSDTEIAFNVDEKDLKDDKVITVIDSKNTATSLKCPRCGSDLVGATDHCPGCGADIRDIINAK